MKNRVFLKRFVMMLWGIFLISCAVFCFRISDLGADPLTCLEAGTSNVSGWSFGNAALIINAVILVFMLFLGRKYIHIGTLMDMVVVGYLSDFLIWGCQQLFGTAPFPIAVRALFMVAGILILALGISSYMCAELGIAPYDAIAPMICDHVPRKLAFRWVRVVIDIVSSVVGFFLGGVVGLATVISAFFLGPLIEFFNQKISRPIIYGKAASSADTAPVSQQQPNSPIKQ